MNGIQLKLQEYAMEYYLLSLAANVDTSLVESKLANLANLDASPKLIIAITHMGSIDLITNLINKIKSISNKLGISCLAIDQQFIPITIKSIADIPVVDIVAHKIDKKKQPPLKSLIIDEPIRSGMLIKHSGDIIINNFVSAGAEIIAGGNVHIYGEARGKVTAGANGDINCRIFVNKFNLQAINIANIYRNIEDDLPTYIHLKSAIISLNENKCLEIKALEA